MLTLLRSFPEHYEEHWGIQKKVKSIFYDTFFLKKASVFAGNCDQNL